MLNYSAQHQEDVYTLVADLVYLICLRLFYPVSGALWQLLTILSVGGKTQYILFDSAIRITIIVCWLCDLSFHKIINILTFKTSCLWRLTFCFYNTQNLTITTRVIYGHVKMNVKLNKIIQGFDGSRFKIHLRSDLQLLKWFCYCYLFLLCRSNNVMASQIGKPSWLSD